MPEITNANDDERLLLTAKQAAALCGVSRSAWYKLSAAGKTPRPVKLGGNIRWRRKEIESWVAASCPVGQKWGNRSQVFDKS